MGLIYGILYLLSGFGLLIEYFGYFQIGLTALLTPAFLGLIGNLISTIKNRKTNG